MALYLAGPMRGLPDFNFSAFEKAAARLRSLGYTVWSPHEHDLNEGFDPTKDDAKPLRYYMRHDLPAVLDSDAVAVLPGWEGSEGASLEVHVARACGIPVIDAETLEPVPIAERAAADRHPASARFLEILGELGSLHERKQRDYGRADDPFANVRAGSAFGVPAWIGCMIRAHDKIVRIQAAARNTLEHGAPELANEALEDSLRDLAVYAVIGLVLLEGH